MDNTGVSRSELSIRTGVRGNRAETIILIDGVDILDLQRPTHRPDGSAYPGEPMTFLPANPLELLPPDSAALLPTVAPGHAMIGICGCGEPGCNSLWVRVRRDGDEVVWEPGPETDANAHTVDATWRFELRRYLDAIDEGRRSRAAWETRPIRIARELRRQRDSLDGVHMLNSVTGAPMRLLNAVAWPGVDYVLIDFASDIGVRQLFLDVDDTRTDQEFIWQLVSIDPIYDRVPRPPVTEQECADGAAATASSAQRGVARVVVGAITFTEHVTVAELYAQALRARGFDVRVRANLGTWESLDRVIAKGWINLFPQYTGVADPEREGLDARPRTAGDAYDAARASEESRGFAMLEPSASRTCGCVVVRREFAREHGLTAIADLAGLGRFSYGGRPELADADALRQVYRLVNLTFRELRFDRHYAALDSGRVDAIAAVATDWQLAGEEYVVLADPEAVFGFQQVAPAVDNRLLAMTSPVFAATLNEVTRLLDPEAVFALNRATGPDGRDPGEVAAEFLTEHGVLA